MLLAPARLPTSHLPQHHHDDGDDGEQPESIHWQHDYSLIFSRRKSGGGGGGHPTRVFCVSLPDIAGVSRGVRGYCTLTEPALDLEKTMTAIHERTVVDIAPSSPPSLSKGSDTESTSDAGSFERLPHFDEVVLDENADCNVKPLARPTLKRLPPKRLSEPGAPASRQRMPQSENEFPSSKGAVNGVLRDQSLNLPHGRGMRRGFNSPTSPSLTMHGPQRLLSRSPSPTKSLPNNNSSPQVGSATTPRSSWSAPSPHPNGPFGRRQSWQPGRKTAKQLEAEVEDGDEDVPEEAILENVPITPFLGTNGGSRSKTPSPHRKPSHHNLSALHSNLHSANVPKNAKRPSAPTIMPNGQYGAPRSPRHGRPPISHSATVGAFPTEPLSHKHRSKSWTEDLNEEARQLSAALEEYAGRISSEKHRSGTNSVTSSVASSPPRPSLSKTRAKTVIMELPQKQKGNIMIDPLPISKEKEAVLTRTRPSWLPPKSQKEEKRHVKEWEQMMARAAELEKKRALRLREQEENKEELQSSLARIWEEHVLPNWDAVIKEPRTRELWWRGVTPKDRGLVWQKAVGNELGLSSNSYEAALKRAEEVEESVAEMPAEERSKSKEAAWFDAIERDVPNVFPELDVFHFGSPVGRALSSVLQAYAMYRSDVGYVYGTHLIAGILCLHMRAPDAFVTLANLLNRPTPLAFLVHDQMAMARAYELVLGTLKYKFTKLHSHLTSSATNLRSEEYLDPIFRCLFAYNLTPEHVSRVWDVFMFEGDKTLIRAAVAVLGRLEGKLYGSREEILELIGWCNEKKWEVGSEEEFVTAVREAGKVDGKREV